ncbi:MAG TPA: dephospho-CoA kinase [Anaerolineaceae bacterium]|nr:dephospho-CoA kinase [Anaerolineaceae bacterium]
MSKWAGKYAIGLTGGIATGKSVVRRMLEHLGTYTIDADTLSHRAISKGAPGYQPIVGAFGRWILNPDGEIDRIKLGKLAFNDPDALAQLEKVIHPLVEQAVDLIIRRAPQPVVGIEAIKLLQSNLRSWCDSIWVVSVPPEVQLTRLMQIRHMNEAEARQRIAAQPSAEQFASAAQVVIHNQGSFEETWRQVSTAWQKLVPQQKEAEPAPVPAGTDFTVLRGKPRHSVEIADLLNRLQKGVKPLTPNDIMAAFGEKAFLLLQSKQKSVGMMGWQVENLVARITDIALESSIPPAQALPVMVTEMEKASRDLQCEAALIFTSPELAAHEAIWSGLGYQKRTPQQLTIGVWQEAAMESMRPGLVMLFKQLRQDRILRPI